MENDTMTSSKGMYPLDVDYCGSCGLPPDLCIYFQNYASCLEWLRRNRPQKFEELMEESFKRLQVQQTTSSIKLKVAKDIQYGIVGISGSLDENRSHLTTITGLSKFGIDMQEASKYIAESFLCDTSIIGEDEIVIHGDFKKELYRLLPEKWEIDPLDIDDLDDPIHT